MSLSKTFCSSPWFHFRVSYDGSFSKCRWMNSQNSANIKTTRLIDYINSQEMKNLRFNMLQGKQSTGCSDCYYEDEFDKISGRTKQLLKSGIKIHDFTNSFLSSPHFKDFQYSYDNAGETTKLPVDLQIDLGNLCNSGCIMCNPRASSKLSKDYNKLYKISGLFSKPIEYSSWVEDAVIFKNFMQDLVQCKELKYIHLLGGETLYNRAFYKICHGLIDAGLSKNLIVGTTTNGTVYSEELEKIIENFKEFHLGISIETVSTLNDYIRYPSQINQVLNNISKFKSLREKFPGLFISLRITPNVFTVYHLDKLLEYAIKNNFTVESCNILSNPRQLKLEIMPDEIRQVVKDNFHVLIQNYKLEKNNIVNVRNKNFIQQTNADSILDYYNFLNNYSVPENVEKLRFELVEFIKAFETIRQNKIVEYLPEYEKFLRNYGY